MVTKKNPVTEQTTGKGKTSGKRKTELIADDPGCGDVTIKSVTLDIADDKKNVAVIIEYSITFKQEDCKPLIVDISGQLETVDQKGVITGQGAKFLKMPLNEKDTKKMITVQTLKTTFCDKIKTVAGITYVVVINAICFCGKTKQIQKKTVYGTVTAEELKRYC